MSSDWVEAEEERGEDASCSFSAGYLSGLLTELAGGPIAVLEVACRARGDDTCSFAPPDPRFYEAGKPTAEMTMGFVER